MQLLSLEHSRYRIEPQFFCIGIISEVNTIDLKGWFRFLLTQSSKRARKRSLSWTIFGFLDGGPRKGRAHISLNVAPRLQRALLRRLSNFSDFLAKKRPERSADSPTSPRNVQQSAGSSKAPPQTPVDA